MDRFFFHRITLHVLLPAILMTAFVGVGAAYGLQALSEPISSDAPVGEIAEEHGLEVYSEPEEVQVTTTKQAILHAPPMAYLRNVASDPTPSTSTEMGIRVPVLMYHHVTPFHVSMNARQRLFVVTPESFEAQMQELYNAGYHTIDTTDFEKALSNNGVTLPTKPVMITFDDGFRDQHEHAVPVLKKFGFKGVFFVVTGATKLRGSMTDAMFKDIEERGVGTIASHTEHHVMLPNYSADMRWKEIAGSKTYLEQVLGHAVTAFAYPYGGWNETVVKELKKAGYTMAFGVRLGSMHYPSSSFVLRRIRVLDKESVLDLVKEFGK